MASSFAPPPSRKGRGATANLESRFSAWHRESDETRHESDMAQECEVKFVTQVAVENARTIISRNTSPDIPFDRSINPYRGCEHGCTYCFARPTHAYLGLSPGLDFETRLYAKLNAAERLDAELRKRGYPLRARHVISAIEQVRDGKHNSSEFGTRMKGTGLHAQLIRQRFHLAARKLGLNQARPPLRNDQFKVPAPDHPQSAHRSRHAPRADSQMPRTEKSRTDDAAADANPQMRLF
ncbi:hypothetical protein [Pandoraea sp. CB10b_02]|uniref:hypothetical protein n=1 Tax=Pandoraea sp. CB10b_02 TaxID=2014535 RepID=UPI00257E7D61|nr:hypothetical protein [Pandoraea sp. CB10b_02]